MKILAGILAVIASFFGYQAYDNLGANTAISALTAKTTLQGDDILAIVDTAGTYTTKKITVTNATTSMKAYNDLTYSPIFSTSAGLAALLSDETGSGGGFVRATNPTMTSAIIGTTATITDPHFDVSGTEAKGDILYFSDAGGTLSRLGIGAGTSYYLRTSSGGVPEWDNSPITFPYSASSTFLATTTFMWSNVLSNALVANGLAYAWPSTRGQNGSVLKENGSGTLSFASSTYSFWLSWGNEVGDAPTDEECAVPFSSRGTWETCDDDAGWIAPTAGIIKNLRTRSTASDVRNDLSNSTTTQSGDRVRFTYEDTGGNARQVIVQINGIDSSISLAASGSAGATFTAVQAEFVPTALTSAE